MTYCYNFVFRAELPACRNSSSGDVDVVWQDKLSISRHIYERGSIVVFRYVMFQAFSGSIIIFFSILQRCLHFKAGNVPAA